MASATAYHGLQLTKPMTSAGVSGTAAVGTGQTNTTLTSAAEAAAFLVEVDDTYSVEIALNDFGATLTGSGVSQVETQTIVGTITATGSINVVVTSARLSGGSLTIPVAVTNGDSASTVGGKVRTALNGLGAITDVFTVGGSGADFSLTETSPNPNDATLNLAYDNGTAAGLTADASSVNTTAGICPARVTRLPGVAWAADNYEGGTINQPNVFYAIEITMLEGQEITVESTALSDVLAAGEVSHKHATGGLVSVANTGSSITFTGGGYYAKCLVVMAFSVLS